MSWGKALAQVSGSTFYVVYRSTIQTGSEILYFILGMLCFSMSPIAQTPCVWLGGNTLLLNRTFAWPFSCPLGLPDTGTIKGCIHGVKTDACHLRCVSPGFRTSTSSLFVTQTGSFHQPLRLSKESCSAMQSVCDGLGYVGNAGGSCRLSIWHSLERDCKRGGCH